MNTKMCSGCKKQCLENLFLAKSKRITKMCLPCRDVSKKYHESHRCEHNKQKYFCLICDGGAYCEHNIQRAMCLTCGGTSLCEHECKKSECKSCNNPVDITIRHMLSASKQTDMLKNRYNQDEFVDYLFLEKLIKESNDTCCYCAEALNYDKRNARLATIERINNSIGHTKSNECQNRLLPM